MATLKERMAKIKAGQKVAVSKSTESKTPFIERWGELGLNTWEGIKNYQPELQKYIKEELIPKQKEGFQQLVDSVPEYKTIGEAVRDVSASLPSSPIEPIFNLGFKNSKKLLGIDEGEGNKSKFGTFIGNSAGTMYNIGAGVISAPFAKPAEKIVKKAVEETGGEKGVVGKTLYTVDDYSKKVGSTLFPNQTKFAQEGLTSAITDSLLGAAGLGTKNAISSAFKKSSKIDAELSNITSGDVKTINDIADDGKLSVDEGVYSIEGEKTISSDTVIKTVRDAFGLENDKHIRTIQRLKNSKNIDESLRILKEEGFNNLATIIDEQKVTTKTNSILDDYLEKIKGGNADNINDLLATNRISKTLENTDEIKFIDNSSKEEIVIKKEKLPENYGEYSLSEILENKLDASLIEEKNINKNLDLLGKDENAEMNIFSELNKLNNKYDLKLNPNDVINTTTGKIDLEGLNLFINKAREQRDINAYLNRDLLIKETKKVGNEIGFTEKVLGKLYSNTKKFWKEKGDIKLKEVEAELNRKNSEYVSASKERQLVLKSEINALKEKFSSYKKGIELKKKLINEAIKTFITIKGKYNIDLNKLRVSLNNSSPKTFQAIIGRTIISAVAKRKNTLIKSIKQNIKILNKMRKDGDENIIKNNNAQFMYAFKALFSEIKEGNLQNLPSDYLEEISLYLDKVINKSKELRKLDVVYNDNKNKSIVGKIEKEIGKGNKIMFIGDYIGTNPNDKMLMNIVRKGFLGIMQWQHIVDIMGGKSSTFSKYMKTAIAEKINVFNIRYNTVNQFAKYVVNKYRIKTLEQSKAIGYYAFVMRRSPSGKLKGWERLYNDYKNNWSEDYKKTLKIDEKDWLPENSNSFLIPVDEWDVIRKTKIGKDLVDVHNNKDGLRDAYNELLKHTENNADMFEKAAMKHDNIILPRDENYFTFIQDGSNVETELDVNINDTKVNNIYDGMLHNTTGAGGPYEYDIFKIFRATNRNMLYYTEMKGIFNRIKAIKKGLEENNLLGKYAGDAISTFINDAATGRIAFDGKPMSRFIQRLTYKGVKFGSDAALMFNLSSAAVQFASYSEGLVELGKYISTGSFYSPFHNIRKTAMRRSSFLYNRLNGHNILQEQLKTGGVTDFVGSVNNIMDIQKEYGFKLLGMADSKVATDIWLGAYKKKFDEFKKQYGLDDGEFEKLNIQECLDYADEVVMRTMGSNDYIFQSKLGQTVFGRILFPLSNSQQSKFGYYLSKGINNYRAGELIGVVTPAAYFLASTMTEMVIRYMVRIAYFELGLSKIDPTKNEDDERKRIENYLIEFAKQNVNNIPLVSNLYKAVEGGILNKPQNQLGAEQLAIDLGKGIWSLIKEEKKLKGLKKKKKEFNNDIDGMIKILRVLRMGDIVKPLETLKKD